MQMISSVRLKSADAGNGRLIDASVLPGARIARAATAKVRSVWARLNLSQKFCAAASVVVVCGMALIGHWVASRIETGVVNNSAAAAALYIDNLVKPHLQELASGSDISDEHKRALDVLMAPEAIMRPIVSFRIWKENTLVYSDRREHIGETFPSTEAVKRAWHGQVTAELKYSMSGEHAPLHPSLELPLLEVYYPVRAQGSPRIIALAETYEVGLPLTDELWTAQLESWLLVGAIGLAILASLFGIVHNGSRTIARQRHALELRIAELSLLLAENDELRMRVNQANERVAENNERFLHSIGADLHDGPMQLLALALLRLDELRSESRNSSGEIAESSGEIEPIRGILTEMMRDLRHISAGLGPPDIENVSLRETLQMVARKHEQRTGTEVRCEFERLDHRVGFPLKASLYRFVQEGLNNAFQHARGIGQAVVATCDGRKVEVKVIDAGPGLARSNGGDKGGGQGLNGLRDRIESLGGTFDVRAIKGGGTCLTARFGATAGDRA
jgi:signal transduction histidine kinase